MLIICYLSSPHTPLPPTLQGRVGSVLHAGGHQGLHGHAQVLTLILT